MKITVYYLTPPEPVQVPNPNYHWFCFWRPKMITKMVSTSKQCTVDTDEDSNSTDDFYQLKRTVIEDAKNDKTD